MIHVLLVEDKNMSRETMGGYIKRSGRYELTASITNAGMAEMACMRYDIDLILMDVCTDNNESGLAAAAVIKRHFPTIKIIVVTSMADSDFMRKAREAGAESFWFKETGEIGLLELMDRTMAGESVYRRSATANRGTAAISGSSRPATKINFCFKSAIISGHLGRLEPAGYSVLPGSAALEQAQGKAPFGKSPLHR